MLSFNIIIKGTYDQVEVFKYKMKMWKKKKTIYSSNATKHTLI